MKKGDTRKQQILEVAERLFYDNGYENTSVQTILDAMHLSKGGFYHHFDTKLSLLEAICVRRAEESYQAVEAEIRSDGLSAIDKLNALLGRSGLFDQDSMDFIALMLQVAYKEGSVMLRERMKQAAMEKAAALIDAVIAQGIAEKSFYTPYPGEIGKLILMLGHTLTDEIGLAMASDRPAAEAIAQIMALLDVYRHAVEALLQAPYGSIVVYGAPRIVDMYCRFKNIDGIQKFEIG